MFAFLQNSYVDILALNGTASGGGALGGDEVVRMEPPSWGTCPRIRDPRAPAPSSRRGHSEKTPSVNQEEGPHQNLKVLEP